MIKKNNKRKLMEYFFNNPNKKLRVREIEKEANIPLPSVTTYTKELIEENILKKETIGNTTFFTTNRTSNNYKFYKKIYNLQELYEKKLIEKLIEEYHNPTIILFGSYDKAEDTEESDIDIYIETTKKEIELQEYEKILRKKIQLFTHKNIKEIKNKELRNNIINGTKINGYIEVFS